MKNLEIKTVRPSHFCLPPTPPTPRQLRETDANLGKSSRILTAMLRR